ncbi:putative ATP-dependent RNA helicase DDX46 isoform X1 [Clavelina lepadiformis]|uniref:putative ATP-dependent RNA helicase DDX46 isoform X1 n=1 Tax=Clavelina lepadiformis TaxID=159417 RepID=UPI004041C568
MSEAETLTTNSVAAASVSNGIATEKSTSKNKKDSKSSEKTAIKKDSKSSKKRHRSRSRSRKRSRSKGRRSRSKHRSPKRRRSPSRRKRRSRSRDRRSRSRDRRRKRSRSKERRSRRSRSRKRKRSRSNSSGSSGSSDEEKKDKKAVSKSKDPSEVNSKSVVDNNKDKQSENDNNVNSIEKEEKVNEKNDAKNVKKPDGKKDRERKNRKRSRSTDRRKRSKSRSRSPHRRKRRRSRSRDRHRRSRERDRSRRSRSRDRRSRSRKRSRSHDKEKSKLTSEKETRKMSSKFTDNDPLSKDFEQAKLEDEMNKRRERVEKWRKEQKLKVDSIKGDKEEGADDEDGSKPRKIWSLEDDDDDYEDDEDDTEKDIDAKEDEESEKESEDKKPEDDEVDPLDAFMINLTKDKYKDENVDEKGKMSENINGGPKVSKIVAVAKKSKAKEPPSKGELMEGNMDAMEYSSEEEEETLEKTFSQFQNKQQPKKLEAEIDHSKINYEPFRKNFYVEVPELAALSQEEVDEMRMNMENIKIRGKNCPKPMQAWVQAGVSYKMLNALKKANYEKPTIIQAQAIPAIMAGNDLIGIAKTGSGKTVAFLLPMLRQIMDQRPLENGEGPIAVIMTPTRELALQITRECKKFSKSLKLRVVCVYGGTGISEQIADLKRGAEIIVCTPGRMIDMLTVNSGRVTNVRRCTYLVLDEADRMFDMGFEPQVMHIIKSCRPDRQTVLFSATFPRQMEALARRILNKPIEVQVGGRSIVCSDVSQEVLVLSEEQKYLKLLELLGQYQENGAVLVFVDKQERADSLLKDLMGSSYSCMALHGGIDQYDRDSIINDFKSGVNRLLIATSVAARGLDVKNLILVVNYSCPNHYEDYVHRCGRTGRAGRKGTAITFITDNQARYAGEIIKAVELSGSKVSQDLENLWTKFKEEQKAQGKSVHANSGFSGRGFKFDETEEALAKERRQIQKAALGLQDSDEDEPAQDIDQQIETMFNSKKSVKDVTGPLANIATSSSGSGAPAASAAGANKAKLDVAKRLASKINLQKNLGAGAQDVMQQAATALMKGGPFQAPKVSAKTIAEQLAEKINQKLNYVPQEKPDTEEEEEEKVLKRYEEELEINDFPQTCRWKVTSKDTLLQICEYSEAGITIRGQYFPPGKQPGEEDRKLYLAIEAISELAVQKAKNEITRLIKEELVRLQNSYQPINKSRYKVM